MNRYSDSESLDSDEGIRFKTESTRYKQNKNLSSSRSRSRSPRRKDRSRSKVEPAPPPTKVEAIGPQLPPRLLSEKANTSSHFGPQLPPHLGKNDNPTDTNIGPELPPKTRHVSIIGPQLPPHLRQQLEEKATLAEGSDEEVYGPLPVGSNFSSAQIALEERALQLKIDQLEPDKNKPPIREEWMLELPEVKASKFGLGPRQFRSKPGPDLSDRSSWTDTPHKKEKKNKVDLKKDAEMKEIRKRDKEQEKISKKLNKNKESLLDLHQSKMSKKKKEEGPSERRPFSRDVDLQVNRFDEAQKKAVLKKAQLLDDRFSSGQSKFL